MVRTCLRTCLHVAVLTKYQTWQTDRHAVTAQFTLCLALCSKNQTAGITKARTTYRVFCKLNIQAVCYILLSFKSCSFTELFQWLQLIWLQKWLWTRQSELTVEILGCNNSTTRSVAAGFGRHGIPPPRQGTALGQHSSDWSRDLATLTFDTTLEVVAPVADVGHRPSSIYQVWSS